jgi:hypothetical protein
LLCAPFLEPCVYKFWNNYTCLYSIVINSQKVILSKQIVIGYKVTYRYKKTYVVGVPTLSKALYNREPKKATSSWKNKHHTLQHNKVVSRFWHPKKTPVKCPLCNENRDNFFRICTHKVPEKVHRANFMFQCTFPFHKMECIFQIKRGIL